VLALCPFVRRYFIFCGTTDGDMYDTHERYPKNRLLDTALWHRCIFTRSYPTRCGFVEPLYRLRTVYLHPFDRRRPITTPNHEHELDLNHGFQDVSRGKAKDIRTINRFDDCRIRKLPS
jgi:hypothetical protein